MKKKEIKVIRIAQPNGGEGIFNATYNNSPYAEDRIILNHSKAREILKRHASFDGYGKKIFPNYYWDDELNSQISESDLESLKYRFAFNTIEKVKIGFTKDELKEAINRLGFRVYEYTVDDYFQSSYQTLFRNPIKEEDITELFI